MPKMSEIDLKAVCAAKIQGAIGWQGGRLARERLQAERFYKGEPFGNELDGRSQVVSRDVAEAVDAMMPSLMRVFASGDEVVRFEPTGPEDERAAAQATDYVNWIWNQQNEGFAVFHSWFKDALLKRAGVVKIWWERTENSTREAYEGLTEDEYRLVAEDPDNEIISHREYPDPASPPSSGSAGADAAPTPPSGTGAAATLAAALAPALGAPAPPRQPPMPLLHDVVLRRTTREGRVRIMPVPPDEFLIDHRAVSLDEAPFVGHRVKRTITELLEMGYAKAKVQSLASDDDGDFAPERTERFRDEDDLPWRGGAPVDGSMREVWVTECYLRVDYDGDGLAELRKVTVAGGDASVVLDNEEVDSHPFAALTPVPMPHKFFGLSVADQAMDLQVVKSTLWRGALDSIYLANAPQIGAVEGQVNLDDLLNRRPGGVVRIKNPAALVPIPTVPVGAEAFSMIEYIDGVREQRTGVTRYNQGLDADTLNKTATGISAIQNAAQQRLELIARIFAETGVKRAFRRVLELVCKHQDRAKIIRLRGSWVSMDPREWDERMDMTVTVGLGTGNRDQQLMHLMALLNLDEKIVQLQGGVAGPLVTARNVYNKLAKLVEASGLRSVESYYPIRVPRRRRCRPQRRRPIHSRSRRRLRCTAPRSNPRSRWRARGSWPMPRSARPRSRRAPRSRPRESAPGWMPA